MTDQTYIDRKGYKVSGERGDWGLFVNDQHGEEIYITHFTRQSDALSLGKQLSNMPSDNWTGIPVSEILNWEAQS